MNQEDVELAIVDIAARPRFEHDPEIHDLWNRCGKRWRKSTLYEMLARVLRARQEARAGEDALTDKDYRQIARAMLDGAWHHEEGYTLAYWQGVFYRWTGPHWVELQPKEMEQKIYDWLDGRVLDNGEDIIECRPGQTMVNEVKEALISYVLISHKTANSWNGAPIADHVISCGNGLLDVVKMELHPHTPRYFVLTSCPADWEGEKDIGSSKWYQFLMQVLGKDQEGLLQEAVGYSLTSDTRHQKAFMMIGAKRSGKGTIMRILGSLVGGLVCSMPTSRFGSDFALQNAIGKSIMQLPDVRIDKNTKHGAIAEAILSVTGEDPQSINRKNRDEWNGILSCKIWVSSNSVPKFRDEDGVLSSRFIYFQLLQSFFGREDITLGKKLDQELSIILYWAVQGYRRLLARGHFAESGRSVALSTQAMVRMDPVGTFVSHRLIFDPKAAILKDRLHIAFHGFCLEHSLTGFTKEGFFKKLAEKDYDGVSAARIRHRDPATDEPMVGDDGQPVRTHVIRGISWQDGMEPTRDQFKEWKDDWVDNHVSEMNADRVVVDLKTHKDSRK